MQDEFYLECPECGEKLMEMGGGDLFCPECKWAGKISGKIGDDKYFSRHWHWYLIAN